MATLLLIVIYITFISLGLPDSILGASFPAIAENLKISPDLAGYISMTVSICTIFSSLCSSFLVKKIGSKWVILSSVLLTAIALLCFSFVKEGYSYLFFVTALPLGLGAGAIDSTLNNYVALHYKALHMNWLHCSWGIGASISPLLIGSMIDSKNNSIGWNKGVLTVSIIQFTIALLIFLSLPLWDKVCQKQKKEERKKEPQEAINVRNLLKNPVLYYALLGFFCYSALESTTGLWVSSYFSLGKGVTTEKAAMLASTFYIGITVGRFLCGFLSLKIHEKNMIRIGEVLIACGILLIFIPASTFFRLSVSLWLV